MFSVPERIKTDPPEALFESRLGGLRQIGRGKVRDLYEIDRDHLLIVTTDRLSAFDVVLPTPIPGKGAVLNRLSQFWFRRTEHIIGNQAHPHTMFGCIHNAFKELEPAHGRFKPDD